MSSASGDRIYIKYLKAASGSPTSWSTDSETEIAAIALGNIDCRKRDENLRTKSELFAEVQRLCEVTTEGMRP